MLDSLKRWAAAKVMGCPTALLAPEHVAEVKRWQVEHRDPGSGVWCVTPPTGDGWQLWPPGSPTGGGFPYDGVAAYAASMHLCEDGCTNGEADKLWLDDLRPWLETWIGEATGGTVTGAVEGYKLYGPDDLLSEYAIYVRVSGGQQ